MQEFVLDVAYMGEWAGLDCECIEFVIAGFFFLFFFFGRGVLEHPPCFSKQYFQLFSWFLMPLNHQVFTGWHSFFLFTFFLCQLVFLWFINFSFCYVFFLLFFSYLSLNVPVWCSWFLVIWFWRGFNSFSVINLFFSICIILV